MKKIKNILLIGKTGNGKSTLANVITNTNDFKESGGGTSETRIVQSKVFVANGIEYRIIDTPGIGDTKLSENQVLDIIAEAVYLVREGLSQAFFVAKTRFDQSEMATYDLLRTIIFDKYVTNHTTIIRTRFENFKNKKKWKDDIDLMIKKAEDRVTELKDNIISKEKIIKQLSSNDAQRQNLLQEIRQLKNELKITNLAEVIKSCQERVIYVSNPPIEVADADDEELELNKEDRAGSRKILLSHLKEVCQDTPYQPSNLKGLSTEIVEFMESKMKLEAELRELSKPKQTQNSVSQEAKAKTEISDKVIKTLASSTTNKIRLLLGKKVQQQSEEENDERIAKLEEKETKLKKEIQSKEQLIRQKVLQHIFNNYDYDSITKETGGNIFLDNIIGEHNWEEIHQEFANKELIVKWLSQGFDYYQVKKWAIALESSFGPQKDAKFCAWLRDDKQLTVEKMKVPNYSIEHLREEYTEWLEKRVSIFDQHNQSLNKRTNQKKISLKNFNKSQMHGGPGGRSFDDLITIQSAINSDSVDSIRVTKVKIRHGDSIDSIQFTYQVKADNEYYEINGDQHGNYYGGREVIVSFEEEEYLISMEIKKRIERWEERKWISKLSLQTYNHRTNKIKNYGEYGITGGLEGLELPVENDKYAVCFFGRSGDLLDAIGLWQSNRIQQLDNISQIEISPK